MLFILNSLLHFNPHIPNYFVSKTQCHGKWNSSNSDVLGNYCRRRQDEPRIRITNRNRAVFSIPDHASTSDPWTTELISDYSKRNQFYRWDLSVSLLPLYKVVLSSWPLSLSEVSSPLREYFLLQTFIIWYPNSF